IVGSRSSNRTLQLSQGWNLIPVLSECEAEVEALFAGKGVIVVKEVAGWQLYWPAFNINTLQNLLPGKAYYVLMGNAETITYPGCTKSGTSSVINSTNPNMMEIIDSAPWNMTGRSAATHIIAFPKQAISESLIKPGDYIGAFDQNGNCYGMIQWENATMGMMLFGDDPTTAMKDGFTANEPINLRLYVVTTGTDYTLEATWDAGWPQQDGTFAANGISAIAGINLGTALTTEDQSSNKNDVLIYPNPAGETLFIDLVNQQEIQLIMTDMHGREMLRQKLLTLRNQIDLTALRSGIYLLQLEGNNFRRIEKIIKK
ncbi:MAG: T9SS type A sorting domain-containing protein, partial [Bacteroidales bacterium]|nr:T9SS type A sorting domain-containing protein [Bacteroidales bacterium]